MPGVEEPRNGNINEEQLLGPPSPPAVRNHSERLLAFDRFDLKTSSSWPRSNSIQIQSNGATPRTPFNSLATTQNGTNTPNGRMGSEEPSSCEGQFVNGCVEEEEEDNGIVFKCSASSEEPMGSPAIRSSLAGGGDQGPNSLPTTNGSPSPTNGPNSLSTTNGSSLLSNGSDHHRLEVDTRGHNGEDEYPPRPRPSPSETQAQVSDPDRPVSRVRSGVRFYSEGANLSPPKSPRKQFSRSIVQKWKNVVERALSMEDPWAIHGIGDLEEEECTRYRYSSIRKKWVTDTVRIKMESESFARGAMRLCYRLKKLSNFHRGSDWSHALNYVAKRYIDPETTRETYFEDVRLQMDAKLWAEEYNRHNPPKKVDIFQITILEFKERADSPLFHLEHFIEGEYMKYNSNSGFVSEVCRQTPHAFSHFTFERSGHQLIVVDVQGVGDLYTDPQIHTKEGKGYGDGNLGTKGMALFFFTHECNEICRKMDLTPFNLSPTEKATRKKHFKPRVDSATVCKGKTIHTCMSPGKEETSDIMEFLRHRTLSASSSEYSNSVTSLPDAIEEEGGHMVNEGSRGDSPPGCRRVDAPRLTSEGSNEVFELPLAQRRNRLDSDMDSIASSTGSTHISEKEAYWEAMRKMSRPAGLNNMGVDSDFPQFVARKQSDDSDGSVLGQVHLDMCRYHELGRFSDEGTEPGVYDKAAAWFHLEIAANCGVLEAILTCARIFLGLPHDLLEEFTVEPDENSEDRGLDWMEMAANRRDRGAMLFLADAYEKGTPLGSERTKSYEKAVHYLEKAMACDEGEEEEQSEASLCVVDTPRYAIHSTMAQLFRTGGFGLEKNPMKAGDLYNEAAEEAMEQAKGKLANKFYMLAEEAWAEVEEEE